MTISKLKYISIILVITTITGFDAYFFDALNRSFDVPFLRYTYLYLFLLPGFFVMHTAIQKNNFKIPQLVYFLLFIGSFYYIETYTHGRFYEPDYDLIRRVTPLYFAYVAMINFGKSFDDYIKMLKTCLTLILLISTLFYLGFMGILETGELSSFDDGRTISSFNLNTISDLNVLGIYITYILHSYGIKYKIFDIKIKPIFFMFYFLLILVFTATRGSMLLFIIGAVVYFRLNLKRASISRRILFFFIAFLTLFVFVLIDFLGVLSSNVFVFDRLLNASYEEEGRYLQIVASWNNFTNNIWYGVGYSKAADNFYDGIIRSNFQYSQILGAGGLILFFSYFTFIFKMFLGKLKNRSNLVIVAMMMFVLVSFIFRRIEMYYAIMAYIVYAETKLMKTKEA